MEEIYLYTPKENEPLPNSFTTIDEYHNHIINNVLKLSYMNTEQAVNHLVSELRKDTSEGSYYYGWQANIAMQFKDEFLSKYPDFDVISLHEISNNAAKNFLNLLCYRPTISNEQQTSQSDTPPSE